MTIKPKLAEKARRYIAENALILDTETTGLDDKAEIVEIAITDARGTFEFSSFVKPSALIPEAASAVHGIYDHDVEHAPNWRDLQPIIAAIIGARRVLAFNAAYDSRLMDQSTRTSGALPLIPNGLQWGCLMEAYMAFTGRDRWNKLSVAAQEIGYSADGAHRALADCKMARAILFHIATYEEPTQAPLITIPPAVAPLAYEAQE